MLPLLLVTASLLLLVQVQVLVLFASATATTAPRFDAMLRFAAQQYSAEYAQWLQSPDQYPHVASPFNKSWTNTNSYQPFTAGFYPGILWQLHNYFTLINDTDEANTWLERAVAVTPGNAPAANMTTTHDIGFVIDNSFINGYRATKNVSYLPVIELAAHSLATRYSPIVQCTRSWNSDTGFLVIIDNMMNIELLNWAGQQFGNATWTDMAWHHAHRTMSSHFRADFSTYQVVEFNETDGSIVAYHTKQGYNVTSTWTRGQAWGTWGFTRAYAYSQYTPFLQRAIDAASLFLTRLHVESPDSVPWWDFDAPYQTGQEPHDSSAGAIVASGMIELGHTLDELRRAAAIDDARALRTLRELDLTGGRGVDAEPFDFIEESLWILGNLSSYAYSLDGHPEYPLPALLTRATGNRPSNQNVNVSIIWGDYYYVEAMVRYSTWYPQDVVEVGVGGVTPVEEGEEVMGDASSVRGRTWWSRKIAPHKNAHAAAATMKDDAQHPSQPIAVKM